jgi:hypothetical protein
VGGLWCLGAVCKCCHLFGGLCSSSGFGLGGRLWQELFEILEEVRSCVEKELGRRRLGSVLILAGTFEESRGTVYISLVYLESDSIAG